MKLSHVVLDIKSSGWGGTGSALHMDSVLPFFCAGTLTHPFFNNKLFFCI